MLRGHQCRIGDAEAALRVLTTERGNSRRYIQDLLASAGWPIRSAHLEIHEELATLGEGETAGEITAPETGDYGEIGPPSEFY